MASGPITSWEIDGEPVETVSDFIFLWFKITADDENTLAPWKKSYDQPRQCIKKQRHYFANKGLIVEAMVFPVVMYGWESWNIKKAERRKMDAVKLWCWEFLGLQGDPTSPSWRRSVLGVHWKDPCWSWNSNTLTTWCEEPTQLKRPWCSERLKAGGKGDDRGCNGWMASPTLCTCVWARPGVGDGHGSLACSSPWDHKKLNTNELLNW